MLSTTKWDHYHCGRFRGKRHRSLSEVARVFNGSHWSGPLFFGLKTGAKEEAGNGAS